MKLDLYMPFFGRDFFTALEGRRECVISAYLRALWYYWGHTHCEGIRDDRELLQRVCHLSEDDWPYAEPIIFGEFFYIDDDHLWQQGRCKEEYLKSFNLYESRRAISLAGVAARQRKALPPPRRKA